MTQVLASFGMLVSAAPQIPQYGPPSHLHQVQQSQPHLQLQHQPQPQQQQPQQSQQQQFSPSTGYNGPSPPDRIGFSPSPQYGSPLSGYPGGPGGYSGGPAAFTGSANLGPLGGLSGGGSGGGGAAPVIHKHVYVHVPPPEPQAPRLRRPVAPPPPPQKHYKIIFIKAPTPPPPEVPEIPQLPQTETKTLVYVLVKKPEPAPPIRYIIQSSKTIHLSFIHLSIITNLSCSVFNHFVQDSCSTSNQAKQAWGLLHPIQDPWKWWGWRRRFPCFVWLHRWPQWHWLLRSWWHWHQHYWHWLSLWRSRIWPSVILECSN